MFFFRLSFTLSVSNIQFHTPTPCPTPPPGTHTSRETQSLVSLDARRFISKAIQLLSPKRVNLLISLPDFLLLHMQWNWENTVPGNVRREQVHMLKISVISYKSTNLRVHRSVSLKCLRFPDQHIKGNIDSLNDTGYPTKFYTGSHCHRNEPITHVYTIFDWKGVLFRVLSCKKWCPLKSHFSLHPLKLLWKPCPSLFLFLNCMNW